MIGERNGADKFNVRVCPMCGKQIVVSVEMLRGQGGYLWIKPNGHKRYYLCSWKCYRLFKKDRIMEKARITAEDAAWLRFARFPVPQEKLPKWMLAE